MAPLATMSLQVVFLAVVGISLLSPTRAAVSGFSASAGEPCEFPDGVVGRCEEITRCLRAEGVAKRNDTIIMCNKGNPTDIVVCCRQPHSVAQKICSAWARYWLRGAQEKNETCSSTKPLIVGGINAEPGEFPNMASLGTYQDDGSIMWFCGGSLITPSFVLTAAHCLLDVKIDANLVVGLGDHDLTTPSTHVLHRLIGEMPEGLEMATTTVSSNFVPVEQLINVSKSDSHPDYRKFYHDIALLQLQRPAVLTNRVLPACLPTSVPDRYTAESIFTVIGWGDIGYRRPLVEKHGSKVLQKVNVGHIEATRCSHYFSQLPLGVTTDIICAGTENKDSCQGDSGGPLMQKAQLASDAGYCQPQMVVGVVSAGPGCTGLGTYARVASYIDWITGMVAPKMLTD